MEAVPSGLACQCGNGLQSTDSGYSCGACGFYFHNNWPMTLQEALAWWKRDVDWGQL